MDDFRTTRWSMVVAASDRDGEGDRALAWLFEAYRDPLYAFVRRRGLDPEDAADTVQGYFLSMMEREGFRDLDPAAGRFRAYLLASMKNFLGKRREKQRAEKRRAQNPSFTVSLDSAEEIFRREAAAGLNAEQLYERRWALTVFQRATDRLAREFEEAGRGDVFERLQGYLTGDAEGAYSDAASELGMTESSVKTAIHRMRKRLGRALRDEVAQTVSDAEQLDDEIRYLLQVLG